MKKRNEKCPIATNNNTKLCQNLYSCYKGVNESMSKIKYTMRILEELNKAMLNSKYSVIPLSYGKSAAYVIEVCSHSDVMPTFSTK